MAYRNTRSGHQALRSQLHETDKGVPTPGTNCGESGREGPGTGALALMMTHSGSDAFWRVRELRGHAWEGYRVKQFIERQHVGM